MAVEGTVFFYNLDANIQRIVTWCAKHRIQNDKMPFVMGNKKITEWKIEKVIFRDAAILLQSELDVVAEDFHLKTRPIVKSDLFFEKITASARRCVKNNTLSLHEALTVFYNFLGWQYFKKRTLPGVAMGKFREIDPQSYNRITEGIIYKDDDDFLQQAYFGGYYAMFANDVISGMNIWKLDVNSFYAYQMRRNFYPWGNISSFYGKDIESHLQDGLGIVSATATIPDGLKLGFLPRKKKDIIDYPVKGIIKGVWTTSEIAYAQKIGYTFTFKEAVFWQFKDKLFSKYVKNLGDIKEKSRGAKRAIAKQLLVSLYGKFAERRTVTVLRKKTEPLKGFHHYIDKAMTIYEDGRYVRKPYSHREISIFTTAYARIMLYQFCTEVGWDNIYTIMIDSVILKHPLDSAFRSKWIDNNKIGKFKIVSRIKEAIILGYGIYALKGDDGEEIIRNQGGEKEQNKLLTYADFVMAKNEKNRLKQGKPRKRK
jgi:hypothetical protein